MTDRPRPATGTVLDRLRAWYGAYARAGHGTAVVACQHGHEAQWAGEIGEYVPLHAGDIRDAIQRIERLGQPIPDITVLNRIRARAEDRQLRNAIKYDAGLVPRPVVPSADDDLDVVLTLVDQLGARTTPIAAADQSAMLNVLGRLVDHQDDPCVPNHHGDCETHLSSRPCAVKEGRELLERIRGAVNVDDLTEAEQQQPTQDKTEFALGGRS